MTPASAANLRGILGSVQGMLDEIGSKRVLLKSELKKTHRASDVLRIKNSTMRLDAELTSIGLSCDFFEGMLDLTGRSHLLV